MKNPHIDSLAMTANKEMSRCNEVISKCFRDAADKLESDLEQKIFLDCIAAFSDELLSKANVVSDENFSSELAEKDSRFKSEKKVISSEDLNDRAAMQQADSHRRSVRETANAVHSIREEALALSAEILDIEIASIQKNKVIFHSNEIKNVPRELREAIEDLEVAITATKNILGQYDALPTSVKELEGLLHQIHVGMNVGQSQTQDAIDAVTEGLLKTRDGDDKEGTSPKEMWADVLASF